MVLPPSEARVSGGLFCETAAWRSRRWRSYGRNGRIGGTRAEWEAGDEVIESACSPRRAWKTHPMWHRLYILLRLEMFEMKGESGQSSLRQPLCSGLRGHWNLSISSCTHLIELRPSVHASLTSCLMSRHDTTDWIHRLVDQHSCVLYGIVGISNRRTG